MKKNLRSVELRSDGRYEYLRIDVEEASKLVETKEWIYISKEEYKRRSKHYSFNPCQGTLVNIINTKGEKSQVLSNNINWDKTLVKMKKGPNSSKLGKGSIGSPSIFRKNKFNGNFYKSK